MPWPVWLLAIIAWLVACWLGFVYVAVPLALAAVALGLLLGAVLAAVGYIRVYGGVEDMQILARPSSTVTRRPHVPYPCWDLGWPNYLSWQVERDIVAAADWPRSLVASYWKAAGTWARRHPERLAIAPPVVLPPVGFLIAMTIGVCGAWAAFAAAVEVVTAIPRLARLVLIESLRAGDASVRWWRGAVATCPSCRWVSQLPAYLCDADNCDVVHRDMRPGRLGVLGRRCRCGARLPTTVLRATRALVPVCPACNGQLHELAGVLPDARIGLSGGPAVGKTLLLMRAAVIMTDGAESAAAWESADEYGTGWLHDARALLASLPEDLPPEHGPQRTTEAALLTLRGGAHRRQRYVHFADVDGNSFLTDANARALRQLSTIRRHLLVLDAMIIPSVSDRIGQPRLAPETDSSADLRSGKVMTSSAMVELPYHLLVAQLNRFGARTRRCSLAIVIAKADLMVAEGMAPDSDSAVISSHRLRAWLCDQDLRHLVEMAEHDFDEVRYFIIGHGMKTADPVAPFTWLLTRHLRGAAIP